MTELLTPHSDDPARATSRVDLVDEERTGLPPGARAFFDWVVVVGIALLVAILVRTFLLAHFVVDGESMESTLDPGDRVALAFRYALAAQPGKPVEYRDALAPEEWPGLIEATVRIDLAQDPNEPIVLSSGINPGRGAPRGRGNTP